MCGGAFIGDCSPGHLYTCKAGPKGGTNNCTLATTCAVGCLTGAGDMPVSANVASLVASDACFNGAAPLSLSSSATPGGNYVTMAATLSVPHLNGGIVNLLGTNTVVPPLCDVPIPRRARATRWISATRASPWGCRPGDLRVP